MIGTMKKFLFAFICLGFLASPHVQGQGSKGLDEILADIQELEGDKDPKCYATASRLEDFMYGTPLSDEARFQKNKLQKRLADLVWRKAEDGSETILPEKN
jgi:hypothetical protein